MKACTSLNKRDQLDVPVDVKKAYEKLNTLEFRKYARKMSWLAQCLDFGEALYGVFDKDVLRKMFNVRKGFHISEEELEKLCNEVPADMTECHLEEGQRFIVAEYLAYDDRYKELLDIQAGKNFIFLMLRKYWTMQGTCIYLRNQHIKSLESFCSMKSG